MRGGGSWAELVLVVAWLAASHCQPSTVDRSASACAGCPARHQEHPARLSHIAARPGSLGGGLQLRGGAGLKRGVVINFLNGEKVDVSDADDVDSNDDWTGERERERGSELARERGREGERGGGRDEERERGKKERGRGRAAPTYERCFRTRTTSTRMTTGPVLPSSSLLLSSLELRDTTVYAP